MIMATAVMKIIVAGIVEQRTATEVVVALKVQHNVVLVVMVVSMKVESNGCRHGG